MIGMSPYMYLKRNREVRKFRDRKVFVDKIDELGDFVEIEYQDSNEDEVSAFLDKVGLGGKTPEALYGDIIKPALEEVSKFAREYNHCFRKVLRELLSSRGAENNA